MISERLAIPELERIFRGESVTGLNDWQLLERYLERRDEAAFEALVTRHGSMVLGVCRRMLGGSPEAEDAFQATFLILVRRARDLGPRDAIGPWLYGVAMRVAARARTRAARRRRIEMTPQEYPDPSRNVAMLDPDLIEILDQELSRLPGKYRSPIVLCYLEGRTHEEAARDLAWPVGTVKGRLARGRELLRSRLGRRGFAPSAGIVGVLSSPDLRVLLDRALVERTVSASVKLAAGQAVAQVVSHSVTSLVEGVLSTMLLSKIKWAALAAVATGFVFTSAAVLGQPQSGPRAGQASETATPTADTDGPSALNPREAEPSGRAQAERKAARPVAPPAGRHSVAIGGGAMGGPPDQADDPRSRQILEKLNEPVSMSFANETPLDDVLKYIKQATTTPKFSGIPIYVDPIGLQEAERSLQSTIQIDLDGVPLRRTLQLVLTQLGLAYFVEDGILVITGEDAAKKPLPPPMAGPSPLDQMLEKSERGELSSTELKELIEVLKLRRQVEEVHAPSESPRGEGFGGAGMVKSVADQTAELLKEVRELIQLLKAEKKEKKPSESK